MNAILTGKGDEQAYSVSKAAGYVWISPGIFYRKEDHKMDIEQARAIIAQAKEDESYEGPMPEDDDKALEEAAALVEMAQTAWSQNVRGPEVEALLRLAEVTENGNGSEHKETPEKAPEAPQSETDGLPDIDLVKNEPWDAYDEDTVPVILEALDAGMEADDDPDGLLAHVWAYETAHENRPEVIARLEEIAAERSEQREEPVTAPEVIEQLSEAIAQTPGKSAEMISQETWAAAEESRQQENREGEIDYSDLVEQVEETLKKDRLHVPEPPTDDPPKLPYDYSKVSDDQLHSLHSVFTSFAYRANYLLQRDERIAALAKMKADEIARELLVAIAKYDEKGHEKKVSLLEAEVESSPKIKDLRKIQRKHEIFATAHRQERDSYAKLVESMSRLETMRQNQWDRSRQ